MQRRHFLVRLSQTLAAPGTLPAVAGIQLRRHPIQTLHLQDCRIAGSLHYGCAVRPQLRPSELTRLSERIQAMRRKTGQASDKNGQFDTNE